MEGSGWCAVSDLYMCVDERIPRLPVAPVCRKCFQLRRKREEKKKYKKYTMAGFGGRAFTTSFRNPRNLTSCVQEVYKKG